LWLTLSLNQDKVRIKKAAVSVADYIKLLSESGATAEGKEDVERSAFEALERSGNCDRTLTSVVKTLATLHGISNVRSEKALDDLAEKSRKSGRADEWARGRGPRMTSVDSLLEAVDMSDRT
jgi:hypothetical protein